jgi:hypothetical protein
MRPATGTELVGKYSVDHCDYVIKRTVILSQELNVLVMTMLSNTVFLQRLYSIDDNE